MKQGVVTEIQAISQKAVEPRTFTAQDGTQLVFVDGELVKEIPRPYRADLAFTKVETLSSLAQLCANLAGLPVEGVPDSRFLACVDAPSLVSIIDVTEPTKHQTIIQASAKCPEAGVLKGFVSLDQTLIELRECFVQTPDVEQLSEIISTVKIEDLAELVDNGLSREVSVKSRVTSGKKGDSTVVNLTLTPIRTFYEVEPVPSQFTMRWKREGEKDVKIRLIEQLSHEWRYKQMQVIAEFLNQQDSLAGIPVLV